MQDCAADDVVARTAVAWREAGEKLGLTGPGLSGGRRLEGCIGPFGVCVEECDGQTRIVVRDERPSALSTLSWHAPPRPVAGSAVPTGDLLFDGQVTTRGEPVLVAALFDASLRRHVLAATGGVGCFEGGVLRLDVPGTVESAAALVSRTRAAVGLARRMAAPRDVAARLASNARHDPVPAVRLRCLDRLCESFPRRALRVLRSALSDPDPAVRLRAAAALPGTDQEALLARARSLEVDEGLQARAIAGLTHPPVRVMGRVLRAALEAIRALGLSASRAALAPLATLSGGEDAARSRGLRPRRARNGRGGRPLRAAVGAHPQDRGLKAAANRAIRAIQARAGAERGRLSIAERPDAGALSLADAERGRSARLPPTPTLNAPGPGGNATTRLTLTPRSNR